MNLNKSQWQAVRFVLIICLIRLVIEVVSTALLLNHIDVENPKISEIVVSLTMSVLYLTGLWGGIYLAIGKRYGRILLGGGVLTFLAEGYFTMAHLKMIEDPMDYSVLYSIVIFILSVGFIGLNHFKSSKGLLLLLMLAVISGVRTLTGYSDLWVFIAEVSRFEELERLITWKISTGEHSWRNVYWLSPVYYSFVMLPKILIFIFLWKSIVRMQYGQSFWSSVHTVDVPDIKNQGDGRWSILFWGLRLPLSVMIFGGIASLAYRSFALKYLMNRPVLENVHYVLSVVVALFLMSVLFRNILLSRYFLQGRKPGFLFWSMLIPVVHFISWIICVLRGPRKVAIPKFEQLPEDATVEELQVAKLNRLKKEFSFSNRNSWLIVLVVIGSMISIFRIVDAFDWNLTTNNAEALKQIGAIMFQLVLLIWYSQDKRAYPFLVGFSMLFAGVIAMGMIYQQFQMMNPFFAIAIINAVMYSALFYFDTIGVSTHSEVENELS